MATALEISKLSLLSTGAMLVAQPSSAEDGWATLLANVDGGVQNPAAVEYQERKSALLLPEYAETYLSVLLASGKLRVTCSLGEIPAASTVFASLVRGRLLAISVWLRFEFGADAGGEWARAMSSALSDTTIEARCAQQPGSSNSDPFRLLSDTSEESLPTTEIHNRVVAAVMQLAGGHLRPRRDPVTHPGARFDAVVASLRSEPSGFSGESGSSSQPPPWKLAAAELLPPVLSPADDYRATYLLDLLGVDAMDSAAGHYFLGRRRILGLVTDAAASSKPALVPNLETWSQLLAESAALQLGAIRSQAVAIERITAQTASPGFAADRLIASQHEMHQDLAEAGNVITSLDPIFWHHQEILKRQSGLTTLAEQLALRSRAVTDLASLQGARWLGSTAQSITVLAAAFGAAAVVEALVHDLGVRGEALIAATVGAGLLAGGIALGLTYWTRLRAARMIQETAR